MCPPRRLRHHGAAWFCGALAAVADGSVRAQVDPPTDPSVLAFDRTFHVGGIGGSHSAAASTVSMVSGRLETFSSGDLVLKLGFEHLSATMPRHAGSTPVGGTYWFDVDGRVVLDFWPTQPGVDEHRWWGDPTGDVLHHAPTLPGRPPCLWLAVAASDAASPARLVGGYEVRGLRLASRGTTWTTSEVDGVLVSNGAGNGSFTGQQRTVAPDGSTTTQALGFAFPFAIASDGELTALGGKGAVAADGEFFFVATSTPARDEVALWLGVKRGDARDLREFDGRYGVSGQSFVMSSSAPAAASASFAGELQLTALGPVAGSAAIDGERAVPTPQPQEPLPLHGPGPAPVALASPNRITVVDAEVQWQLTASRNGRYLLGREAGAAGSLLFGRRHTSRSEGVGFGTGSFTPGLGMVGFPQLGNANWGLHVTGGRGGAPAMLAIGARATAGLWLLDEFVWVDPQSLLALPVFTLGGPAGVLGAGTAVHRVPVPHDPTFVGAEFVVQALVLEPLRPSRVAMSRGLRVRIGR